MDGGRASPLYRHPVREAVEDYTVNRVYRISTIGLYRVWRVYRVYRTRLHSTRYILYGTGYGTNLFSVQLRIKMGSKFSDCTPQRKNLADTFHLAKRNLLQAALDDHQNGLCCAMPFTFRFITSMQYTYLSFHSLQLDYSRRTNDHG